jgi:hypothetical protein
MPLLRHHFEESQATMGRRGKIRDKSGRSNIFKLGGGGGWCRAAHPEKSISGIGHLVQDYANAVRVVDQTTHLRPSMERPMPPITTRLVALLALCLTLEVPAQTNGCPAGEKPVCLDSCVCLPDLGLMADGIYQMAAPALALWLTQARAEADIAGTQPIPPHIREQLLRWYDPSVLDTARYKVSDNSQMNAATAMLQNPDVGAVTLIDIILFRDAQTAEQDLALWAHELKHVQQYQEWGVEGFAQRYTQDFNAVEAPAYAIQAEVRRSLREAAD